MTGTDRAEDKQSLGNRCSCPRGTGGDAGKLGIKGLEKEELGGGKRARVAILSARKYPGRRGRLRFPAAKALFPKN